MVKKSTVITLSIIGVLLIAAIVLNSIFGFVKFQALSTPKESLDTGIGCSDSKECIDLALKEGYDIQKANELVYCENTCKIKIDINKINTNIAELKQ